MTNQIFDRGQGGPDFGPSSSDSGDELSERDRRIGQVARGALGGQPWTPQGGGFDATAGGTGNATDDAIGSVAAAILGEQSAPGTRDEQATADTETSAWQRGYKPGEVNENRTLVYDGSDWVAKRPGQPSSDGSSFWDDIQEQFVPYPSDGAPSGLPPIDLSELPPPPAPIAEDRTPPPPEWDASLSADDWDGVVPPPPPLEDAVGYDGLTSTATDFDGEEWQ